MQPAADFEAQTVFHFEDPIAFLNHQLRERQKRNPRFSLRAWARQMGYQNPSLLFQVLKGQRRLKMDLANKIAANLKLKGRSLRYFEIIVLSGTSQSETEKRVFEEMLHKLRPRNLQTVDALSLNLFSAASEWYHWAILSLVDLEGFRPEVEWIQERLGDDLDKKTIRSAIDRLVTLGLLVKNEDGTLSEPSEAVEPLFMQNQIPSAAIRLYHKQMIEKALRAVDAQSPEERQLRSSTIAFRKADLPLVNDIIAEAHRQILELSTKANGEDLYQINTQFFRLTQKKVERSH